MTDDHHDWQQFTDGVTPLKGRHKHDSSTAPIAPIEIATPATPYHNITYSSHQPELIINNLANLNRKTAQNLKSGELTIDATLDLHGKTIEQAFQALSQFLMNASAQGNRIVLVITGKGKKEEGTLKQELPNWINHELIRPLLVSVHLASVKHGGDGAVYMVIKKRVPSH